MESSVKRTILIVVATAGRAAPKYGDVCSAIQNHTDVIPRTGIFSGRQVHNVRRRLSCFPVLAQGSPHCQYMQLQVDIPAHLALSAQKEAAWAVTNTTTSGTPEQVVMLIGKYQILKPFCDLLDTKDARTTIVVLVWFDKSFLFSWEIRRNWKFSDYHRREWWFGQIGSPSKPWKRRGLQKAYALIQAYISNDEANDSAELEPKTIGNN